MSARHETHRARWVFPMTDAPDGGVLHDAVIEVVRDDTEGAKIATLRARDKGEVATVDHGDVALLPAWVNPHTHLEFSDRRKPFAARGAAFPDWIREVVASRRTVPEPDRQLSKRQAIAAGLFESRDCGVGTLGEISTAPVHLADYALSGCPDVVSFRELIANDPAHVPMCMQHMDDHRIQCERSGIRPGISPHAPYTVSFELLQAACRWSETHRVPLAFHYAESVDERLLLDSASGPFIELLQDAGVWRDDQFGVRPPIDYVTEITKSFRAALIHGNYLDPTEAQLLALRRAQVTVVYCPRTHHYFSHAPYPLRAYLDLGIRVAIGTDSRASNPDLDLRRDLLHAGESHPEVTPAEWLAMVTRHAAYAIGQEHVAGRLAEGMPFRYVTVPVTASSKVDPLEAVWVGLASTAGAVE